MSYFVDLSLFFCYIFVSAGLPLRRVNPGYTPWTAGEPSGLHLCCCRSLRFPRRSQFSQAVEHETSSPWPSAHPTPLLSAFDGPSDSLDHTPKATSEKELDKTTPERKKGSLKPSICGVLPKLHKSAHVDQRWVTSLPTRQYLMCFAQWQPAHLLLSLLHLQIGTHGVQKSHRHHLHPLPPLHHPKNKLCFLEATLTSAVVPQKLFFHHTETLPLRYGKGFLQVPPLPTLHRYLLRSPVVSGIKPTKMPLLSVWVRCEKLQNSIARGNTQADQKSQKKGGLEHQIFTSRA